MSINLGGSDVLSASDRNEMRSWERIGYDMVESGQNEFSYLRHTFNRKLNKYRIYHIPLLNFMILGVFGYLLIRLSSKYHELYTRSSLLATIATNVVLYGISDTCAQSIGAVVDCKKADIESMGGNSLDVTDINSDSLTSHQNDIGGVYQDQSDTNDPIGTFVDYGDTNSIATTRAYILPENYYSNNISNHRNRAIFTVNEETDTPVGRFEARRFVGFIAWGFIMAFIQVVWYSFLNFMFTDMPSIVSVLERDLTDQLLFSPLSLASFFAYSTAVIEGGDLEMYKEKMYRMYITTYFVSISIWFPVQFINFLIMPRGFQVPFSSSVGVLWNCFLSFKNARG